MNRISSQSGMTLVEIMIVLIILAVVMTTVGGKIIGAGDKAKVDVTKLQMQQLKSDIEQFQLRYNSIPSSLNDLIRCSEKTGQGCVPIAKEDDMKDAWGNPFAYTSSGRTYKISSLGADGVSGGDGVDFDVFIEGP